MTKTPKKQKPLNQKGKSVYFNLDDPGEFGLYQYAMSIKNFSGYMKSKLYADMIQNNGQAPNPYEFAAKMITEVVPHGTPPSTQHPSAVQSPVTSSDDLVVASTEASNPDPILEDDSVGDDPHNSAENDGHPNSDDDNEGDASNTGSEKPKAKDTSSFMM